MQIPREQLRDASVGAAAARGGTEQGLDLGCFKAIL